MSDQPSDRTPIDRRDVEPTNDRDDDAPESPIDEDAWDANDERRQKDCYAPPMEPCECYCLHCQRTFSSDKIWLQKVINGRDGFEGFWMCPTNNCGGAGFTFDIFPTDPEHPANAGWTDSDDEDEDEFEFGDEDDDDDEDDDENLDEFELALNASEGVPTTEPEEYDPAEPKYAALDGMGGDDELIEEGDEWKLGLAPGESPPPEAYWSPQARAEWQEEQSLYDAPDERPREIDAANESRDASSESSGDSFKDDDIPF